MSDNDLIPNTGSAWTTAKEGEDIPRSKREDLYSPPASARNFISWVESRDYIDFTEKFRIRQRYDEFRQERDKGRVM